MSLRFLFTSLILLLTTAVATADDSFPPVVNSQQEGEHPPTPEEAAALISVPEGFQVTLFAGEPDVSQPISMEMDDRGRVWVAECYTYAKRGYDNSMRDRIVILHDTDGDGKHDVRKIFWDKGDRLTSVLPGSHGCWILNDGTLAWLADEDGDDVADGEPEVFLEGFDKDQVGHNIVNGLMYGPTGWIYGRHGIQATSYVGAPGTPPEQRTRMNCSIWRWHPRDHRFELVTEGTTNPWGLDYNEYGDFFFTNNVIGHAWHVIPGAHYKRIYGADFNPHFYELIDQHADHYHWDHSASWTDSREDNGIHGKLGGGHSHCGGMIYLGDNWPDKYRGMLFMCNTHGKRVNMDIPVREGSGYVIKHGEDFLFANNPWFRGVDLMYGPDGGVYLSDWTDLGECHDRDGVHRTSGRIYKITYGKPEPFTGDLMEMSNEELFKLHFNKNQWFVRHSRRILMDRIATAEDFVEAFKEYGETISKDPVIAQNLTWTNFALGFYEYEFPSMVILSCDISEHMISSAIHYVSDRIDLAYKHDEKNKKVAIQEWEMICRFAEREPRPYVRLAYTSIIQRVAHELRFDMAKALGQYPEDEHDHNIHLMLWYGLEPAVARYPEHAVELTQIESFTKLRRFIARRVMHLAMEDANNYQYLLQMIQQSNSPVHAEQLLLGMQAATSGVRQLPKPKGWDQVAEQYGDSEREATRKAMQELSLIFGSGRAMEELLKVISNKEAIPLDRMQAIGTLAERQPPELLPVLKQNISDRAVAPAAIAALARYDDPQIPGLILNRYRWLKKPAKAAALETLCSRPAYAKALLDAMQREDFAELELTASQARQIRNFEDSELTKLLEQVWGTFNITPAEQQQKIERLKATLTAEALKNADLPAGRKLFDQSCANCHKLFNNGKELAPDLTGGNRQNLDYLLENIITPSAVVPNQYKVSTFVLTSGRVINGVIKRETEQIVTVQTEKEELDIPRNDIELVKPSQLSLMPEGLIDKLSEAQIRDLFGYLQSSSQVSPAE